MPKSGKWLQEFQYFRAVAIIEVIVIHATPIIQQTDLTILNPTKDIVIGVWAFASFGVAHFLFISGAVLYNKYREGFSLSMFYKKRFSAVLPPYLIFSTFYFFYPYVAAPLYAAISHHPTIHTWNVSLAQLMSGYLTALVIGIDQLWFVVLLMQLYLLYPVLIIFYGHFARQQHPLYALALLLLVQTAYTSAFPATGYPIVFRDFFLNGIFYFVLGFFVSEHFEAIKQKLANVSLTKISLAVALATIYYVVVFYHVLLPGPVPPYYAWLYQVTGPFYCVLLILFYFRIFMSWGKPSGLLTKYLERIGEDSFGIFLTHLFFISVFAYTLPLIGVGFENLLFYPTLVFLTLVCSEVSVQVLYRLPGSAVLIGKRRREAA